MCAGHWTPEVHAGGKQCVPAIGPLRSMQGGKQCVVSLGLFVWGGEDCMQRLMVCKACLTPICWCTKIPPPPLPGHWTPEVHAGGGGSVHTLAGGHVFGVHHVFGNVDTGCTGNPVLGGPVLSVMLYVCGTDLQPHSPLYSQVWAQPGGLW